MSTSFVVAPPVMFRSNEYLLRLNNIFDLHPDLQATTIGIAVGCTLHDAESLMDFLVRNGYAIRKQRTYCRKYGPVDYIVPRLPITFVASLDARRQFAAGGRR